jgi:hypothetical protein
MGKKVGVIGSGIPRQTLAIVVHLWISKQRLDARIQTAETVGPT